MSQDENLVTSNSATRRWVIGSGALLAGAGLLSQALAAEADPAGHAHEAKDGGVGDLKVPHVKVAEAAAACILSSEICLAHCTATLSKGDTSLRECMAAVLAMMPMCQALLRYATIEAPRLKELAKLCMDVCSDCEKECDKHAGHHAVCKACADACADCIKECKALIAA